VASLRVRANALDLAIYRRVRNVARTPDTVRWVRSYSRLGEHGGVWLATGAAGIALDAGHRRRWARATVCVGAAYLVSTSIKLAVGRRRPVVEDLPHLMATPTGLSFPSSHATSSFAAARAFGRLLPSPALYAAAAAMGLSRLYLGVHYPSDVAAGAALGTVMGSLGR
jgi:membrane-associated phospholipid phosphatase